ncbi:hypothetical protein [Gymnodinialimonas hymeniacidonis]|uniref:hypothetical protein n=1 Tax=Gymnodinialimonas hymeniacidonis TaxID=3126508 RepID=UPI0034C62BBC
MRYAIAFGIWLILSVLVLVAMVRLPFDVTDQFFYARSVPELALAVIGWMVAPSLLALVVTLLATARPLPRASQWTRSLFGAFVILGGMFTLWLVVLNGVNRAPGGGAAPVLVGLMVVLALVLPGLSYLRVPVVVSETPLRLASGPWWSVLAIVTSVMVIFAAVSVVLPPTAIASFAEARGGHYYTWLNVVGPAMLVSVALSGAVGLALSWARALAADATPPDSD